MLRSQKETASQRLVSIALDICTQPEKLADGTPFIQSTPVTASPFIQWPLFIVLKKGGEILAGTVEFFLSTGPLGGYVTWEKSAQSNDLYYPQGFRHEFPINGTGYLAPELRENQLLDCNNILVSIDGGTLPIHFASTATVTPDYRIVIDDPTNQIAISINITDGLFSGTATPAGQSQPILFQGALLQHFPDGTLLTGYFGSGFFLQDNLSGRIKIVALP